MIPLLLTTLALPLSHQESAGEPPRSLFTAPLFLGESPPECRAAAVILVSTSERTQADALERARAIVAQARAGGDFGALARSQSDGLEGALGGVLGSLPPGALEEEADRFLFSAELDAVSEPLETSQGYTVWRRIERWAACEYLLVPGADEAARQRADQAKVELRRGVRLEAGAGEAVERVAFERGPNDRLLKLAAFETPLGEAFGPLETPLGWVVGRRVPVEAVPVEERENNWVRARALVVLDSEQPTLAVRERIEELHGRLAEGRDLAALARAHTEEPTARDRDGDLGWLHRFHPTRSRLLDGLFVVAPGTVGEPLAFRGGWVVLQRTR